MEKLLVTVREACAALGIGHSKFYNLVGDGKIPVRKLGKRTLIAVADLQRFADSLPTMVPTAQQNRALPSNQP